MYIFFDYFFVLFHSCLVLFVVSAWSWRKTRLAHLVISSLVLLSWFGLGIFYGWGYCPCTEWHWEVKDKLGETNLPDSYVKYYADKLTGLSWSPFIINTGVLVLAVLAFILSCWLNFRDYYAFRRNRWHFK